MSEHHVAGQGAVLVDVGDDAGALVLYTDAAMEGVEIDISPVGDDTARTHVAVHTRPVPGHAPLFAAVYPSLTHGRYRLWHPGRDAAGTVDIEAGRVTETTWQHVVEAG